MPVTACAPVGSYRWADTAEFRPLQLERRASATGWVHLTEEPLGLLAALQVKAASFTMHHTLIPRRCLNSCVDALGLSGEVFCLALTLACWDC